VCERGEKGEIVVEFFVGKKLGLLLEESEDKGGEEGDAVAGEIRDKFQEGTFGDTEEEVEEDPDRRSHPLRAPASRRKQFDTSSFRRSLNRLTEPSVPSLFTLPSPSIPLLSIDEGFILKTLPPFFQ